MFLKSLLLFLLCLQLSCNQDNKLESADISSKELEKAAKVDEVGKVKKAKKIILFFLNPGGRPCQIQEEILNKMKGQLNGVKIVNVSTAKMEDRAKFYTYGIRALPAIIILDINGKEEHRFSPGIQDSNIILKYL